jgi:hypothetical protein
MIHAYTYSDPVQAHDSMCKQLVYGKESGVDFDWIHGTEVGLHNVSIHCDTIDFDYDLKRIWVLPGRWRKMVRDYINPDQRELVRGLIESRFVGKGRNARGIAVMRTNTIQGRGEGRNVRRRWGSCMLSLSFRATPTPTITLHSRTTYFGYLALMDMAVARTFAAECSEQTGIPVSDMEFVWTLELAQFHGFRSLAWMLGNESNRDRMFKYIDRRREFGPTNRPGFRKALDGFARIKASDDEGKLYGDERFSSFCRVRRRFHTEVYGTEHAEQFAGGVVPHPRTGQIRQVGIFQPLQSLWVHDLDFSALSAPSEAYEDDEGDDEDE